MRYRKMPLVALLMALPLAARASTIRPTECLWLLPNTAGQEITLEISGTDSYTDSNLSLTVNDGVGPAPKITHIFGTAEGAIPFPNLNGSVWQFGSGGVHGTSATDTGYSAGAGFVVAGSFPTNASGLYAVVTVSTVGVPAGSYFISLEGTDLYNGLDENLNPVPVPLALYHFVICPEPSSVVLGLLGAATIAAVGIRRAGRHA